MTRLVVGLGAALLVGVARAEAPALLEVEGAPFEVEEAPFEVEEPSTGQGGARATLSGRWVEHATLDTAWGAGETVFELASTLGVALGWEASEELGLVVEGRLRHRLGFVHEGEAGGHEAGVGGRFEPELRRLELTWRAAHGPEVAGGLLAPRWGRTSLTRPLDLLTAPDWRAGPLGPEGDERAPVPAVVARLGVGQGRIEAVYAPFFVPMRLPLRGELAPDSAGLLEGTFAGLAGVDDLAEIAAEPRLAGFDQDGVGSASLALRATQRLGPLDAELVWVWGRDRVPGPSGHERQHAAGLALAGAVGPLGLAAEAVVLADRRMWRADGASERHLAIDWAFEVQAAPWVFLDVTLGLGGAHAPAAAGRFLGAAPDALWGEGRIELLLAWDGVLRLEGRGRYEVLRESWWGTLGIAWRATQAWEVSVGGAVFGGEAVDLGPGALYEGHDHVWLRSAFVF